MRCILAFFGARERGRFAFYGLVALREALKSRNRSSPVLHSARYHRGRVYEEMGQPGRARQDYEAIFAQNPGFADVRARLGR